MASFIEDGLKYPKAKDFAICALKIGTNCAYRKRLAPDTYFFNDRIKYIEERARYEINKDALPLDFYAPNISIQAIVGKNGSGKSSLLELIYRLVNNFSFMLELGMYHSDAAKDLCYVNGLDMELLFVMDGRIGVLQATGDVMKFSYDNYEKSLAFIREGIANDTNVRVQVDVDNQHEVEAKIKAPVRQMAEVARRFFYTVVTNYSIHSLCDDDYSNESVSVEAHSDKDIKLVRSTTRRAVTVDNRVWINSVYHKNDGYRTPIVLNPYRNNGVIDLNKEYNLAQYRLSAIFLHAQRMKMSIMENYSLHDVSYRFDKEMALKKLNKHLYGERASVMDNAQNNPYLTGILPLPVKSYFKVVLDYYGVGALMTAHNDVGRAACIYLVYKVFHIARVYSVYFKYKVFGDVHDLLQPVREWELLSDFLEKLDHDQSHITIKLKQVQTLLNLLLKDDKTSAILLQDFTYFTYFNLLLENKIAKDTTNFQQRMHTLPPAFFRIDIKLDSLDNAAKEPISINRMSSGERQFLYNSSTFVYHMFNLRSITDTMRVRYRCVNLIFDEVEMCYHPEYQREFIYRLVELIKRLRLNFHMSVNIMIATHSPFILSDIPKQNVLYLEDGHDVSEKILQKPYAANVNSILQQSFFLQDSFMGEFARLRVRDLIDRIQKLSANTQIPVDEYKKEIQMIGDDYLRSQLLSYLDFMDTKRYL